MEKINNRQYWNFGLTLTLSIVIFLLFSLIQTIILFFFIPDTLPHVDAKNIAYMHLGVISSISSIIGLLLLMVVIKIKNKSIRDYLDIYIPTKTISVIFLCISICLMFIIEYISDLYPNMFETDFVIESYRQATSLPLFYIGVVFLGPLFEEFLFRGFLFKGLEKSFLGGHGAVFVSAILFSLVHIQYGLSILLCMLLPLSILLGYAKLKSRSILLPVLIHMINNFATCLISHSEIYGFF